jgi:anti-sigma regulatory factor (Ser/Thr protein kinase)
LFNAGPQKGDAPSRIDVRVPAGHDAPARAREAIRPLDARLGAECVEAVELVVSELVTNSVRHSGARAGDAIIVEVRCSHDRVRVSVADPGHGFAPPAAPPEPGALAGWGLHLVAEVADRWWIEPGTVGTRVVVEI